MSLFRLLSGQAVPGVAGSARVWVGRVTLSSGTYTLDYSADLPGVGGSLANEPVIIPVGKQAPNEVGVSSAGTSQATLSDGSGSSSDSVNVLVVEDVEGV